LTSAVPGVGHSAEFVREPTGRVALAHDYLATVGGAERVMASIAKAFPRAPIYTSLFEPLLLSPGLLAGHDVRPGPLNRFGFLRNHYRLAMPFLAGSFRRQHVDADVVVCSSSGWSHGISTTGRKIVYCYNPARWLYQRDEYLSAGNRLWSVAATLARPLLLRWDQRAAASCSRYLACSSIVANRIRENYGRDAEVLPPPVSLDTAGPQECVAGVGEEAFCLSVSRLMAHKNVDVLIDAFRRLPKQRLVIAGDGPDRSRLVADAPSNVLFVGQVSDSQLRWLYSRGSALLSASREDFGLTPVEAGLFGMPSLLLRYGGFLDNMVEGRTALFFERLNAIDVADGVRDVLSHPWQPEDLMNNAKRFSEASFHARLREIVAEELLCG
jgi:glycosyltransferase involved in cell wall biosynthesis